MKSTNEETIIFFRITKKRNSYYNYFTLYLNLPVAKNLLPIDLGSSER